MCKAVMEALAGAGYALTDYEAALFLPAVVEKSGHNQVGGQGGLRCVPTPSEKREMRTPGGRQGRSVPFWAIDVLMFATFAQRLSFCAVLVPSRLERTVPPPPGVSPR